MSQQPGLLRRSLNVLAMLAAGAALAQGQGTTSRPSATSRQAPGGERPEAIVARGLRVNPFTAPYAIGATWRDGRVVLSGRVGTKQAHDAAVHLAIACGFPFRDDLVIDTAESLRVAAAAAATAGAPGYAALAPSLSPTYYVYPQPLFGRLDDPFFGMTPPLLSFAPWWRPSEENLALRRAAIGQQAPNPAALRDAERRAMSGGSGGSTLNHEESASAQPPNPPPVKGDLEITVDATGQVFLRGVVASEEVAREIEQTARSAPGVTRVVSQFQIQPRRAEDSQSPPPPPEPIVKPSGDEKLPPPPNPPAVGPANAQAQPELPLQPQVQPRPRAASPGVSALDAQRLTRRVVDSLERRRLLAGLPIKVRSTGDVVTLSGQVPSAYEAMAAFRAVQQTPGVRDVLDRLEFLVPDEDHPNPLVQKGRPEDVEPYLISQIGRHLGDIAHVDRVQAHGDILEIRGSLLDAHDRERVLATLRSIPVLHGFKLEPTFTAD